MTLSKTLATSLSQKAIQRIFVTNCRIFLNITGHFLKISTWDNSKLNQSKENMIIGDIHMGVNTPHDLGGQQGWGEGGYLYICTDRAIIKYCRKVVDIL